MHVISTCSVLKKKQITNRAWGEGADQEEQFNLRKRNKNFEN